MIVQSCLNGARPAGFHPALPLTPAAMAGDGAACIAAGANELHLHARHAAGHETLEGSTMDATVRAVRDACPGTLIGVSTGAWIEGDERRTLAAIDAWRELPDYASVNLAEPGAAAVMDRLRHRGIGIEAGLASAADAKLLVALGQAGHAIRILIEVAEQDPNEARAVADGIAAALDRAGVRRPVLLHGLDATAWQFVALAAARRWSTRIGLEDGATLPDGATTPGNPALAAAAARMLRHPG